MTLTVGTQLGHYEITEAIGEGGMGEVYRARDSKLKRDVAIKVLPEAFAQDKERLERFEREARLLAQLNHPNVATLYGVEDSDGQPFLVMELVSGETLGERIARGPMPLDEALRVFRQIAEGLEAAHDEGIVHRDLKPANIKIGADGTPKILDFGLAKAAEADSDAAGEGGSQSPTLTKGTALGVILGTAAYMSPEQARGRIVDKRSDIWAFGCCLYEALTGKKAFLGQSVTDTLAAVIRADPDWKVLPAETPEAVRRFLRRSLEKQRSERVPDIAVARLEIDDALSSDTAVSVPPTSRRGALAVAAAIGAAAMGFVIGSLGGFDSRASRAPIRTAILLPEDTRLAVGGDSGSVGSSPLALSPDGLRIAFVGKRGGTTELYVHTLADMTTETVPETQNAAGVFFSPDGHSLGFQVTGGFYSAGAGVLKKISLASGTPVTLHEGTVRGASWENDGSIWFGTYAGVLKIASSGGEPTPVALAEGAFYVSPQLLPGGEALLVTINRIDKQDIAVLPVAGGVPEVLAEGFGARYLPTGHVLFHRGTSLWALPFDAKRLEVTGDAVPVLSNVGAGDLPMPYFSADRNGNLVYVPESATPKHDSRIVWVDREGHEEPISMEPGYYRVPRISPDGSRFVVDTAGTASPSDIWMYDLKSGTTTRFTFDPAVDAHPVWSPDGARVAFLSWRNGFGLYSKDASGSGDVERLVTRPNNIATQGFTPNGEALIAYETDSATESNIVILDMTGERTIRPLIKTAFSEHGASLSPDGRWLAYSSNESGRFEIYVRPFPDVEDGQWQVSTNGGAEPVWGPEGRELFYRSENRMMRVPVRTAPTFVAGAPKTLFEGPYLFHRARNYDISPDGTRFLMVKDAVEDEASDRQYLVLIQNFAEELERLVPTGK